MKQNEEQTGAAKTSERRSRCTEDEEKVAGARRGSRRHRPNDPTPHANKAVLGLCGSGGRH